MRFFFFCGFLERRTNVGQARPTPGTTDKSFEIWGLAERALARPHSPIFGVIYQLFISGNILAQLGENITKFDKNNLQKYECNGFTRSPPL